MDFKRMLQEARNIQKKNELMKEELAKKEFVVEKQGIKVYMNGAGMLNKVDINAALMDPEDKDIIEDLLVIAINESQATVQEAIAAIEAQTQQG